MKSSFDRGENYISRVERGVGVGGFWTADFQSFPDGTSTWGSIFMRISNESANSRWSGINFTKISLYFYPLLYLQIFAQTMESE